MTSLHTVCPLTERATPESDAVLSAIYSRGGRTDWDRLFLLVRPLVRTVAGRDFRLSEDDQEDIYQLVCLKLYEHLGQLKDPRAFKTWLRCMTRRVVLDHLRQRRELASLDAMNEEVELPELEPEPWEDRAALRVELQRAMNRLPEKYRDPLRLHVWEGEEQEDVSRVLGRPRSTVASQIHRGLARLRRSLSALEAA